MIDEVNGSYKNSPSQSISSQDPHRSYSSIVDKILGHLCHVAALLFIQIGTARLDVDMLKPQIFHMQVKFGLKFMSVVCTNAMNAKWNFRD